MSSVVFGPAYAQQYDLLCGDKDSEAECDALEELFLQHAEVEVHEVLDLGRGTRGHAIPLARRGYWATAVDRSAPMLALAKEKAAAGGPTFPSGPPQFIQRNIHDLELGATFDAVLTMFAVLGYPLTNDQVSSALRSVRRHLRTGGPFICDIWHGPAVLNIGPSDRVKVVSTKDGQIVRVATADLDVSRQICNVRYRLWSMEGDRVTASVEEDHAVRFFFPMEIEHHLLANVLRPMGMMPFPGLAGVVDETSWNVLVLGIAGETARSK